MSPVQNPNIPWKRTFSWFFQQLLNKSLNEDSILTNFVKKLEFCVSLKSFVKPQSKIWLRGALKKTLTNIFRICSSIIWCIFWPGSCIHEHLKNVPNKNDKKQRNFYSCNKIQSKREKKRNFVNLTAQASFCV